jgi:hypothetical protein
LIFLVRDGETVFVPQARYASLLRGETRLIDDAGASVRVADWYYELSASGEPRLVNETYRVLYFDATGTIDWPRCRVGGPRNQALYESLRTSSYDDPDEDPAVQRLRAQMCDEVTWLPDREERARLHAAARQALQPAT